MLVVAPFVSVLLGLFSTVSDAALSVRGGRLHELTAASTQQVLALFWTLKVLEPIRLKQDLELSFKYIDGPVGGGKLQSRSAPWKYRVKRGPASSSAVGGFFGLNSRTLSILSEDLERCSLSSHAHSWVRMK
ncbi:hypothetical protein KC320_g79 [Hortaea werneckii]|nr:hypothetical protein KC320_g79 [Hortaea werneckii]